jgi:WD40 repeat protein
LRVRVWRLGDDRKASEIELDAAPWPVESPGELAFSGRGRDLIIGGLEGSIRSWTLDEATPKVARAHQPIPPDPGQIRSISPAPDGRSFVRVCEDGKAFLFDFDKRASTPLNHRWNSLAFLPDRRLVGTLSIDARDEPLPEPRRRNALGGPVVYDIIRNDFEIGVFLPPEKPDASPLKLDRMAVSADGAWIAVDRGSGASKKEMLLWSGSGKAPVRSLGTDHGVDRITAFALPPSGGEVVVCTPERATLYDGPRSRSELEIRRLVAPGRKGVEFSAAAFAPPGPWAKDSRLIALGTRNNGVVLWSPGSKQEIRPLGGSFDVKVETLTFTAADDRLWLVASGLDKGFTAWELTPDGRVVEVKIDPSGPRHDGVIRDIKAWPKLSMIATAGDDSTVRFWSLKDRRLIGTLAFSRVGLEEKDGLNWVAFSPDGRFDCPPEAKGLLKLVRDGQPIRIDQAAGSFLDDKDLMERILAAKVPEPTPEAETPPRVALKSISPLEPDQTSPNRAIYLELLLDAPDPKDLRLYRNELPMRSVDGFEKLDDDPRRYRAFVTLRKGENKFRAVAARGEGIEGSSDELTVRYRGEDDASRVHVLAIGINEYSKAELKLHYAVRDAEDLGKRLGELDRQANGKPLDDPILLRVDDQVDEEQIKLAFRRLGDQVKNRPGDKVVVFLAGHTDKFGEDFGLLLCKKKDGASSILRYSAILQGLAQLDAEHRLVIVDACQTDKIQSGEEALRFARSELRAIQRNTLKYPTQYILASKGLENQELGHGLLTYTLLRGLGLKEIPPRLKDDPASVASFSKPADEDNDGNVTTDELNRYASSRLPLLLAAYENSPQVARGRLEELRARREADRLRVGSDPTIAPFDLVRLRNPAP